MKNISFKMLFSIITASVLFGSCSKDLNRLPANQVFGDSVYSTPAGFKMSLANVYGAYTFSGINGPNGASDIAGVDGGTSDFIRGLWNTQELPTDEAVCAWGDPGVPDLHKLAWTGADPILIGLYSRSLYQVALCNDFITHCNSIPTSGFSTTDITNIGYYKAEARFLRAFQYAMLMDEFGNPPFTTETTPVGVLSYPSQIGRDSLFKYVEKELLACSTTLPAPMQNEYGRADQAAAWALLARIYLNAQVYTGTPRFTDAITYSSKVINSGYSLMSVYANLFKADNNLNNPEVIMAIPYDGINTESYGGTTFLVNSACASQTPDTVRTTVNNVTTVTLNGYHMVPAAYGVPNGGWGGNRSTSALTSLFPTPDTTIDKRGLFLDSARVSSVISDVSQFSQGIPVVKFTNITSTGVAAEPSAGGTFCSTDYPLFRLGEQYLIYAEAVIRGGSGGSSATALKYLNLLRERAYGHPGIAGTDSDYPSLPTLQEILNERGRELYWECLRRSDLIRFNQFTNGTYLWPWKGGVANGTGVDGHYNLFPIPNTDLSANTKLVQNPGY